jgi:GNAT superfamily N-acetyltransferase
VSVRIVPAAARDAELCLALQRTAAVAAFQHVFPQDRYPFPNEAVRAGWARALADPDVEVHLALVDDEAVGSVSIGRGYLRTLYVAPVAWNRGVGSRLHDFALDRLHLRGVVEARLWTLEENHHARGFYERRGWTLTGRTRVVPFPPNPLDVEYARSLARVGQAPGAETSSNLQS